MKVTKIKTKEGLRKGEFCYIKDGMIFKTEISKEKPYCREYTIEAFAEEEPTTFDCGFKALAWLRENPMREIECTGEGHLIIVRFNNKLEFKINKYDTMWDDFTFSVENILEFKNIKVLTTTKEETK